MGFAVGDVEEFHLDRCGFCWQRVGAGLGSRAAVADNFLDLGGLVELFQEGDNSHRSASKCPCYNERSVSWPHALEGQPAEKRRTPDGAKAWP